jgi:hypothetical protein
MVRALFVFTPVVSVRISSIYQVVDSLLAPEDFLVDLVFLWPTVFQSNHDSKDLLR